MVATQDGILGNRSNPLRGANTSLFGPDVTEKFLARNKLSLLIRSHQVKSKGFDMCHYGKCVTVFSAPNYCGELRNQAALIRFTQSDSMKWEVVQFNCAAKERRRKEMVRW